MPPGPPFPEELHLRKVCGIVWTHAGEDDSPALSEARACRKPLLDGIAPVPLPGWNSAFDAVYPAGDQWYWRGEFLREIPDDAIDRPRRVRRGDADLEVDDAPVSRSTVRPSRVGSDETAWAYRDARWAQVIAGVDPDPANAGAIRDWARAYSDALRPHALGGGYVNFQMHEPDRVRAHVRPELRPAGTGQGAVRPEQRVQRQPEHRAGA